MSYSYIAESYKLEQQTTGATEPEQMGTTGLIAWVALAPHSRLYHRLRRARSVIRKRLGDRALIGFDRAVILGSVNKAKQLHTADLINSLQKQETR